MEKFTIDISYSQIAIFNGNLSNPFNDWTDDHYSQGFSWRDESVSFITLIDAGMASVEVVVAEDPPTPAGVRAITVPFVCREGGVIEAASIASGQVTGVPAGSYQLLFETGYTGDQYWCHFTFIPNGSMLPMILIPDVEITRTRDLVMFAEPA